MGLKFIELSMPIAYDEDYLKATIQKVIKTNNFACNIDLKSLDARKKSNIHWKLRVLVSSDALEGGIKDTVEELEIHRIKTKQKVIVVGSGPAGFFAAEILQRSGFSVTILERGKEVSQRAKDIANFESNGAMPVNSNYVYGEGGAGTFSDGKLTSRTKSISSEKKYVVKRYIDAGAPDEIAYLSKPHIGSNNLKKIVKNLRKDFENTGGKIVFGAEVTCIKKTAGNTWYLDTANGSFEAALLIFACGHSSYDTYRMLMKSGVKFIAKPFAMGVRVEHNQRIINKAQWGKEKINGLKAAEYVLTHKGNDSAVFSFCMCPGGKIVQASPQPGYSIVNGMSSYLRNSEYANSAIVVSVKPAQLLGKEGSAIEILEYVENFEKSIYDIKNSFEIPAMRISDFCAGKGSSGNAETSYSHGIFEYDFNSIFPGIITESLKEAFKNFSKKIHGFEEGIMMGLESKTSSSIQVVRKDNNGSCAGFKNLYVAGECSGYAGGIISSAVDGIKTAQAIVKENL